MVLIKKLKIVFAGFFYPIWRFMATFVCFRTKLVFPENILMVLCLIKKDDKLSPDKYEIIS